MAKIWMLLVAILAVSSCNSEKRAAKKVVKQVNKAKYTFAEYPDSFAAQCAIQFPPTIATKESETVVHGPVDTIRSQAKKDITYDIVKLLRAARNDSIKERIIDSLLSHPVILKADCPDVYVTHDTIKTSKETETENTAKVVALTDQVNSLLTAKVAAETKLADKEQTIMAAGRKIRNLGFGLAGLALLIVAYIGVKLFFKRI